MTLVTLVDILSEAQKQRYAASLFASWSVESLRSIVCAAEEERSPAIIGFHRDFLKGPQSLGYPELEYYATIGKIAASKASIPLALLANEVKSLELARTCLDRGFSSVMIDGSGLPFEENVRLTKKVAELAHSSGASVEGSLGGIPSAEDGVLIDKITDNFRTDPEQAAFFVEETNVDALAVSVGNVHGSYKRVYAVDFNRLKAIHEVVDKPLVIHGGTGFPPDSVRRAICLGVCKFNFGAGLRLSFTKGMKRFIKANPDYMKKYTYREIEQEIIMSAESEMRSTVQYYMRLCGCAKKAY